MSNIGQDNFFEQVSSRDDLSYLDSNDILPESQFEQSEPSSERWASELLFFDGDSYFKRLCYDINHAKKSVFLETYIFYNDPLGKRVAVCLMQAAQRGVDVRVIVDGFGSPLWKFQFQNLLRRAGIKTKIFHRIPFSILRFFPYLVFHFQEFYSLLERRNHRKLCVIDEEIAFLGSMNIASYHLREFVGKDAWRDTGVRVVGAGVTALCDAYLSTWKSTLFHPITAIKKFPLVRVYISRKLKKAMYAQFLREIESAKERIWLTTAYFVPRGSLLRSLKTAAKRGVEIRILTTAKTDVFIIRWMKFTFYKGLISAGAKIYEYQPSILHAKCALIDDFAMVGSTNLNNRSFFHDLEVDIVLNSQKSKTLLESQFLIDASNSKRIFESDYKNPKLGSRILTWFALLFRKLI